MKQLRGRVVSKPFGGISKSSHEAVMLVTASEGEYVLRRKSGNPFHDPELDELVGKEIVASGEITGYTMILSDWEVVA